MPVWDFHLTASSLSPAEKASLATAITSIYTSIGLPAFYVQVRFTESSPSSYFFGGLDTSSPLPSTNASNTTNNTNSETKYAGLQIWHIARTMTTPEVKEKFLQSVDDVLNPIFKGKGWHWEYFVTESPRDLWKINGFVPPLPEEEGERVWRERGVAVDLGGDGEF